jgi:predicted nucleic acid-binding protein
LFANRYTAFIDACSLAGALKRNLLLTLAEAGFYRVRWSEAVMGEAQRAIKDIMEKRHVADAEGRSAAAVAVMIEAFDDAMVTDFDDFLSVAQGLPDRDDAHVLAAALKTRAHVIVTDNMKDFPSSVLAPLNIEARTTDEFIANTITLDPGKAVGAFREMRRRLNRPQKSPADLFIDMEASGLVLTVDALRPYEESL